jgi:lipoprotein-anchoring transpeptidase ErfK/SrfK
VKPKMKRALLLGILVAAGLFALLELFGWLLGGGIRFGAAARAEAERPGRSQSLRAANEALRNKLADLAPHGVFVVVDTAGNRVYLRQRSVVLREMTASCGSGNILEEPGGGRKWVFDTPRGQFRVQSKTSNPLWVKPDWAYIEEGEPIPKDSRERALPGMLGDFALGLGKGYFIHGTMYTRLLGRNVSHGCIRLGDEDLKALVQATSIGTKVIIF